MPRTFASSKAWPGHSRLKRERGTFVCLLISLSLVGIALGQTNTGSITGTVLDQQNAVMVGVRIAATNLATNVSQTSMASPVA
jgi:hypothetical protein